MSATIEGLEPAEYEADNDGAGGVMDDLEPAEYEGAPMPPDGQTFVEEEPPLDALVPPAITRPGAWLSRGPAPHEMTFAVGGRTVPNEAAARLRRQADDAADDHQAGVLLDLAAKTSKARPIDVEIARKFGVSLEIARSHAETLSVAATRYGMDGARWRREHPAAFLALTRNPALASLVTKDVAVRKFVTDVDGLASLQAFEARRPSGGMPSIPRVERVSARTMTGIERNVGGVSAFTEQLGESVAQHRISVNGFRLLVAEARGDDQGAGVLRRAIQQQIEDIGPAKFYPERASAGADIGRALGSQVGSLPALGVGVAGGALAIAAPPAAPYALAGAALLSAATVFPAETGGAFLEMEGVADIDPHTRRVAAALYGLAASGVEVASLGVAGRFLMGPLAKALTGGGSKALREVLAKPSVRATLKQVALAIPASALNEGLEEGVQQTMQVLSAHWARGWSAASRGRGAPALDRDKAAEEIGESVRIGAIGGAVGFGGMAAVATAATHLVGIGVARRNGATISKLADLRESATAHEAPTAVLDLVRDAVGRGVIPTTLVVDPRAIVQMAQEAETTPQALADELLGEGGAARLADAQAARVDAPGERATLTIETSEFMEKLGDSKAARMLLQDIAAAPGEMTARELADVDERTQVMAKILVSQAGAFDQAASGIPGDKDSEQALALEAALVEAGHAVNEARVQVATHRAYARVIAERGGLDEAAVWAALSTRVGSQAALDAGTSASRQIAAKMRRASVTEAAGMLSRDHLTGALSWGGFMAAPQPEGHGKVAVIAVEGLKWRNSIDHGEGDKHFRAVANALKGLSPLVGRSGGDFVVAVRDEAHAEQIRSAVAAGATASLLRGKAPTAGLLDVRIATADRGADVAVGVADATTRLRADIAGAEESGARSSRGGAPMAVRELDPSLVGFAETAPIEHALSPEHVTAARRMTPAERMNAVAFDKPTGMLTRAGWDMIARRKHVAVLDLNKLRDINNRYGAEVGDGLIVEFAEAVRLAGGMALDAARVGGDEFWFQADDAATLHEFIRYLDALAQSIHSEMRVKVDAPGVFTVGVGADTMAADRAASEAKRDGQNGVAESLGSLFSDLGDRDNAGVVRARETIARGFRRHASPTPLGSPRAASARGARIREIEQARLDILTNAAGRDAEALREALVKASAEPSAFSDAVADSVARHAAAADRPRFRNKADAFDRIMDASGLDESVTGKADAAWLRGEKPGPWPGGGMDPADHWLEGRGRGKRAHRRVSGVREAFDRIMAQARGPLHERAEIAVDVLREVTGMESLRLPDEFHEARAAEVAAREEREAEDAYWSRVEAGAGDIRAFAPDGEFTLFQGDESPRGWAALKDAASKQFRIFLASGHDLSTFSHESAHVFLSVLDELASDEKAGSGVVALRNDAHKALGVKTGKTPTREQHEKFAKAFEAYLLRGKAPSAGLAGVFAAFRVWLAGVYRTLAGVGVDLDPALASVFDRMLATDAEIAEMANARGLLGVPWRSHVEAGMTPAEFEEHLSARLLATDAAAMRVRSMVAEDEARTLARLKSDEGRRALAQAADEYGGLPSVRAWGRIANGVALVDGVAVKDKALAGLDREFTGRLIGDNVAAAAMLEPHLIADGQHPVQVAQSMGFASAAEMFKAMAAKPDREAWLAKRTREIVAENNPTLASEAARVERAAAEALGGDITAKWVLDELKALHRNTKRGGDVPTMAEFRVAAADLVDRSMLFAVKPAALQRRERRAARLAVEHAARGNFTDAVVASQQRVLSYAMHDAANVALGEFEELRDEVARVRKVDRQQQIGKAGQDYLDAVNAIVSAVIGDREAHTLPGDIVAVANKLENELGVSLAFDAQGVEAVIGRRGDPRSMTVIEMRNMLFALRNISTAARGATTVLLKGKRMAKEAAVERIVNEINGSTAFAGENAQHNTRQMETVVEKARNSGLTVDAYMLRQTTLLDMLAGDGAGSAIRSYILDELRGATHRERGINNQSVAPVIDAMTKLTPKARRGMWERIDTTAIFKTHTAQVAPPESRLELVMMAANYGNEGNRQRLLDGRGITGDEVIQALGLLTAEELRMAQRIVDAAEGLWPMIVELEERDTGVIPDKVNPAPFTVQSADGESVDMRGGYFPAVYVPGLSAAADRREADRVTMATMLPSSTSMRPTTNRSATKKRAAKVVAPISLDPTNIGRHLFEVAHDLAFRETVRSVGGMLLDPAVGDALRLKVGKRAYNSLKLWVKDIGGMVETDAHASEAIRNMRRFAGLHTVGMLGYSVVHVVGDYVTTPFVQLAKDPGMAPHLASAYYRVVAVEGFRDDVRRKSAVVRDRLESGAIAYSRELQKLEAAKSRVGSVFDFIRRHAFVLQEQADAVLAPVIWQANYDMAVAKGADDKQASEAGDKAVTDYLPAQTTMDMNELQRDKRFLSVMFTMTGYTSTVYQAQRRAVQPTVTAIRSKAPAPKIMLAAMRSVASLLVIGLVANALGDLFMGRGPDPDDEDRWAKWMLMRLTVGQFMTVPFIGWAAERATGGTSNVRTVPLFSMVERVAKEIPPIFEAIANEDDYDRGWQLLRATAPFFGIPDKGLRALEYMHDFAAGEAIYTDPLGIVSGVVYGEREGQLLNPITAFER